MQSENEHRFDDTIATFAHPHYEMIPTGDVYDGEAAVREYYRASRALVPDQRNELLAMHSTDDGVVVEFRLFGTPIGAAHGFDCRMTAFFDFDDDRIVAERVYWDRRTIEEQIRAEEER
jgi:ketosteroid isomerase-like protein